MNLVGVVRRHNRNVAWWSYSVILNKKNRRSLIVLTLTIDQNSDYHWDSRVFRGFGSRLRGFRVTVESSYWVTGVWVQVTRSIPLKRIAFNSWKEAGSRCKLLVVNQGLRVGLHRGYKNLCSPACAWIKLPLPFLIKSSSSLNENGEWKANN